MEKIRRLSLSPPASFSPRPAPPSSVQLALSKPSSTTSPAPRLANPSQTPRLSAANSVQIAKSRQILLLRLKMMTTIMMRLPARLLAESEGVERGMILLPSLEARRGLQARARVKEQPIRRSLMMKRM